MIVTDPFAFVSGVPIPSTPVVATGVIEGVEAGRPGGSGGAAGVGDGIPDYARDRNNVEGPGASLDRGASFEVSVALERPAYPRSGFTEDDIFVSSVYQNDGPLTATWEYTDNGSTYNEGQGAPPYIDYINGGIATDQGTLQDAPEDQLWRAREVRVFGLAGSSSSTGEVFDIRFYVRQTSGPLVGESE